MAEFKFFLKVSLLVIGLMALTSEQRVDAKALPNFCKDMSIPWYMFKQLCEFQPGPFGVRGSHQNPFARAYAVDNMAESQADKRDGEFFTPQEGDFGDFIRWMKLNGMNQRY